MAQALAPQQRRQLGVQLSLKPQCRRKSWPKKGLSGGGGRTPQDNPQLSHIQPTRAPRPIPRASLR